MDNSDFQKFLEVQQEVYDRLKNGTDAIIKEGLSANKYKGKGAYFIAFRPLTMARQSIAELAVRIRRIVPETVQYTQDKIHITITDIGQFDNFRPDTQILDKLSTIVRESMANIKKPDIEYTKWLLSHEAVILAGMPNDAFLDAAYTIREHASLHGINLRLPWGAHITVARFDKAIGPGESVDKLVRYVNDAKPVGLISPFCIDVGYGMYYKENAGFMFNTHSRYDLR